MFGALLGIVLGLVAGIRHAFEPDHVAAVTAMAAGERKATRVVRFATAWGAGHAVMLVGVGGLLFVFRRTMPPAVDNALELVVAAALVALGVRSLRTTKHVHNTPNTHTRLPFLVGLVHGLSGSGALTALAVSKLMTVGEGLVFMTLYAAGALIGMSALAGVLGVPLSRLAQRPAITRGIIAASGAFSLVVGIAWAFPILAKLASAQF